MFKERIIEILSEELFILLEIRKGWEQVINSWMLKYQFLNFKVPNFK